MENEIIKAEEFGIEEVKAEELTLGLAIPIAERKSLIDEFDKIKDLEITEENLPIFKALRLKIVKNRTQGIMKWHKASKAFFLAGGKFVDATKNKELQINESMEAVLIKAENHFADIEKAKMESLQAERVALMSQYVDDAEKMSLASLEPFVFESFLTGAKVKFDAKIAEEKRISDELIEKEKAEKIERERIKKENEVLRKQAEEREKKEKEDQAERLKIENARIAKEKKEQEKRDAIALAEKEKNEEALRLANEKQKDIERKAKAESDALKAKIEAKEKADRIALEKVEADKKAEQLAKEQALQAELNKGDSEKVKDLISDLTELTNKYTFTSEKNKKKYLGVCELIIKVITYINK